QSGSDQDRRLDRRSRPRRRRRRRRDRRPRHARGRGEGGAELYRAVPQGAAQGAGGGEGGEEAQGGGVAPLYWLNVVKSPTAKLAARRESPANIKVTSSLLAASTLSIFAASAAFRALVNGVKKALTSPALLSLF